MHLCETASSREDAIDVLAVFASQARACGLPVAIHRKSLPQGLGGSQLYELAPLVTDRAIEDARGLVVIGADTMPDESLLRIRRLTGSNPLPTLAFGDFPSDQARIAATARLSYALNAEPRICEINGAPGFPSASAPVFSADIVPALAPKPRVLFLLPDVEDAASVSAVRTFAASQTFDVGVIVHGKTKGEWADRLGGRVPVWHLGELMPLSFARRFDIALLCDKPMRWYRYQSLVANLVGSGAALIDATEGQLWSDLPDGIIAGGLDGPSLLAWMRQDIVPSLADIAAAQTRSKLSRHCALPAALSALGDTRAPSAKKRRSRGDAGKGRIVFMPTNGVGLGHAKRCSQVARALETPKRAVFAAFPSCVPMLNKAGFDAMPLVSKTPHRGNTTNDFVNHARLDALCAGASGLVFDGGFVFESIVRSVANNHIPSIWIRRGLWQESQNNSVAVDRAKIFDRIIVPTEAFDELNHAAPAARNAVEVGPIMQRVELGPDKTASLRQAVCARVGEGDKRIVVTMLGGGVAADRNAQINAICAHLAARDDVVNLLVIWPTSVVDPAWFSHPNTAVVQTYHASALIMAADLLVSAAGYNSFHEAIYGGVPTIFVPQMASFMDDQRARARAASERGISLLVEPWETLRLVQAVDECLDGRAAELRDKLVGINLPPIGNADAARAVEEVCR